MSEQKTLVLENTTRRDALIEIEKKYQKIWDEEAIFEQDAPEFPEEWSEEELHKKYPKYMATMAYPYMNGVLHAGHSFTLSKAEFAVGYERMKGKKALFPLGFHCTGMPIKACADKLVREVEQFGPNFDQNQEEAEQVEAPVASEKAVKTDPTKFKAQKSKAVAKQGSSKYQYQIMLQLGIPREEVHKFADPRYWIEYFPPKCEADCKLFGGRIDWRRSMVTTDVNPYYDSFVRWQMNTLKSLGKIKFGKRYTIFSPKDDQPCMDHDRQTGEAVNPQEYVGIKIKITEFPEAAKKVLGDLVNQNVYLVAATLRPETMYGQTCCFVSPKIDYGVFDAGNGVYYITTERAFRNMAFQDLTPKRGYFKSVVDINGSDLIGAKINAPLSAYKEVRVLPMETILPTKGTGVVTCVPSDSPDDYITTLDLKKKAEYYKIDSSWVIDDILPVIETPTYGDLTAKTLVENLKIQSPKDKEKLAEAKELAYKEGFYQGIMLVGKYKGKKVEEAKPLVRQDMIDSGDAFVYSEPENLVISRSGDVCVVSLQDQWFNNYGEASWREQAEKALSRMNTFGPETRHSFEKVLEWLGNWALSRTYGLGTRIPWDPQYLVESLSDSTIYMAYYTIAHYLHSDFDGQKPGLLNIPAKDMTDDVWNYVFCRSDSVEGSNIPQDKLKKLRESFRYFYPLDLRVSGKDLIPNHLTFFLYCHTAIFDEEYWPQGVRANGHLMLNNEKMSKSTGNFMTLREMLQKFGTDASRIALADAGDTFEDANFDEANANAAILRLHTLKEWMESILATKDQLRTGKFNFFDTAFSNELNLLIKQAEEGYENAMYKGALKSGLFDLQIARDYYRDVSNTLGFGMHRDLVLRYIEVQALLLQPIAPHFGEYVWRDLLGNKSSAQDAKFPKVSEPVNQSALDAITYVRDTSRAIREAEGALMKKNKKAKGPAFDVKAPSRLSIYIATEFPEWQQSYIELVRSMQDSLDFKDNTGAFKKEVSKLGDPKRGMQFVSMLRQQLVAGDTPDHVLNRKLLFDEEEVAKEGKAVFEKSAQGVNIQEIQIVVVNNGEGKELFTGEKVEVPTSKPVQDATPGSPGIVITNI